MAKTPPERDPETKVPIWARNDAGQPICGYPTSNKRNRARAHDACQDTKLGANGRCHRPKHGGNPLTGHDNPSTTHGNYSNDRKIITTRVLNMEVPPGQGGGPSKTGMQMLQEGIVEGIEKRDPRIIIHAWQQVDGTPDSKIEIMISDERLLRELGSYVASEWEGKQIETAQFLEGFTKWLGQIQSA